MTEIIRHGQTLRDPVTPCHDGASALRWIGKSRKTTAVVVTVHVILLALICLLNTGRRPVQRGTARLSAVSFVSLKSTASQRALPVPAQPPRSPATPSVAPHSPVTSQTSAHRRPPIVRSTNLMVRTPVQQPAQVPTAEQIRGELLAILPASEREAGTPNDSDRALLHATYYGAWTPPRHDVGDATVTARIVFEPDGRVREAAVIAPSGDRELDASVALALRQVHEVPGLSRAVLSGQGAATIVFAVDP